MLRPVREDDMRFVIGNWLASYASSEWASLVTPGGAKHSRSSGTGMTRVEVAQDYWDGHRQLIAALVPASNTVVLEAADGLLDGFVCRDHMRPVVHYAYVRSSARRRGVFRELLGELWGRSDVAFTHKPRGLDFAKLPRGWKYDPYLLMVTT